MDATKAPSQFPATTEFPPYLPSELYTEIPPLLDIMLALHRALTPAPRTTDPAILAGLLHLISKLDEPYLLYFDIAMAGGGFDVELLSMWTGACNPRPLVEAFQETEESLQIRQRLHARIIEVVRFAETGTNPPGEVVKDIWSMWYRHLGIFNGLRSAAGPRA